MPGDAVAESLERLAERVGDPAPLVYARLFARHPETEALFLMDAGGHVRGQMLAMAFELLLNEMYQNHTIKFCHWILNNTSIGHLCQSSGQVHAGAGP